MPSETGHGGAGITVGGRVVAHTAVVHLIRDADAWIEFTASGAPVRVRVTTLKNEGDSGAYHSAEVRMQVNDDHAELQLLHFPQGVAATVEPIPLATLGSRERLLVTLWYQRQGEVARVELQFAKEAAV